jgi:hypothetical protein
VPAPVITIDAPGLESIYASSFCGSLNRAMYGSYRKRRLRV